MNKNSDNKLKRILNQFIGIDENDLTTLEKNILKILKENNE